MKKIIRKGNERGYFDHGWLQTFHSFSFADYYDQNFMNFSDLRVINDDVVAAQSGFDFHPHKNMEIITYIIDGALTHLDSLKNKEEIEAGSIQVMSAGAGIVHSEFNYGQKSCHLLQIWIRPSLINEAPYYKIAKINHLDKFALIASFDGRENSVAIRQDAEIFVIDAQNLHEINLPQTNLKHCWIHVAQGEIIHDELTLKSGDAIGLEVRNLQRKIIFVAATKLLIFYLR